MLLLENPVGEKILTFEQLQLETTTLMKIYVRHKLYFYESCSGAGGCGLELVSSFGNLTDYHGKTLFVSETELSSSECKSFSSLPRQVAPHCQFSTITVNGGRLATVLAENPAGCVLTLDHKLIFQK